MQGLLAALGGLGALAAALYAFSIVWKKKHGLVQGDQAAPAGGENTGASSASSLLGDIDDTDLEPPDEFKDSITYQLMTDPVILCATGQVYDYSSIQGWFKTGNRRCPVTNIELHDVQIVRLTEMRKRISAWLEEHGQPSLPARADAVDEELMAKLPEEASRWISELHSGEMSSRDRAMARINDLFVGWARKPEDAPPAAVQRRFWKMVNDHVVWVLRHGSSYGSSVAAAVLSFASSRGDLLWLGAVALLPICNLLHSSEAYPQHAAAMVLAKIASCEHAPIASILQRAGAVGGLLRQLADSSFPYERSYAAVVMRHLASHAGCREEMLRLGAVAALQMLIQQAKTRFETRDAAGALVTLFRQAPERCGLQQSVRILYHWYHCSDAWLFNRMPHPQHGYSKLELDRFVVVLDADLDDAAGVLAGAAPQGDAPRLREDLSHCLPPRILRRAARRETVAGAAVWPALAAAAMVLDMAPPLPFAEAFAPPSAAPASRCFGPLLPALTEALVRYPANAPLSASALRVRPPGVAWRLGRRWMTLRVLERLDFLEILGRSNEEVTPPTQLLLRLALALQLCLEAAEQVAEAQDGSGGGAEDARDDDAVADPGADTDTDDGSSEADVAGATADTDGELMALQD